MGSPCARVPEFRARTLRGGCEKSGCVIPSIRRGADKPVALGSAPPTKNRSGNYQRASVAENRGFGVVAMVATSAEAARSPVMRREFRSHIIATDGWPLAL